MGFRQVNTPDGLVQFPDTMGDDEIKSVLRRKYAKNEDNYSADPIEGMGKLQLGLAGAGKAVADLGRGAGQMLGLVSDQDVEESRKRDAALMETGAGKVGNFAGNALALAPAMMVPGANAYAGSALSGAAFGSLQPTVEGESRLGNAAAGTALGVAGKFGGDRLANAMASRFAGQQAAKTANQPFDDILKKSVDAGYTVPPSYAKAGTIPRIAEGISGKYKTNQLAGIRNQEVTNDLVKKSLGIPKDQPVTADTLNNIRKQAFNDGYAPVKSSGRIQTDTQFAADLDGAVQQFSEVAADFPELVDDEILKVVDGLRKDSFDSSSALSAIKLIRDKASKYYRNGDTAQGKAAREAAGAIENQVERHLSGMGENGTAMLEKFRASRQLIAKTHSVESSLSGANNVDAAALARQLRKGKPLSGEIKDVAEFAGQFGDVAKVPKSGDANPITALDWGFGSSTGLIGGALGGPAGALAAALPTAARLGSRYSILSKPAQQAMAKKSYDPTMLAKLLANKQLQRAIPGAAIVGTAESN